MTKSSYTSAEIINALRTNAERIEKELRCYLHDAGAEHSVDEIKAGLHKEFQDNRTLPHDYFLALNMTRLQLATSELFAEMTLTCIEEAIDLMVERPFEAFDWMMKAEGCLGQARGLLESYQLQNAQHRAKQVRSDAAALSQPKPQAFQADVLQFLEREQPDEGWTEKEAVNAYVNQDTEESTPLIRNADPEYWAGIRSKLKSWLRGPKFKAEFTARLKAKNLQNISFGNS